MRKIKKYSLISLIENSEERYLIKDPFENLLEDIINKNIKNNNEIWEDLEDFIESNLIKYSKFHSKNKNINQKSKARVIYVSPQELPSGIGWKVLGQYDPLTHTIYMANNLSPNDERFVYYHEEAHSLGIMSESQADDYAASKTGYNLRNSYGMAA